MFITVPSLLNSCIDDVSPGYWRLQAIIVKTGNSRLLVINSYFPTDPLTIRFNESDLIETLEFVNKILEDNIFSSVLLLGDINYDFLRRTGHVNMVDSFITMKSFIKSWSKFHVDFTRSQQNEKQFISSTLDHFFWNEDLDEQIIDAGVLHSSDNDSDQILAEDLELQL